MHFTEPVFRPPMEAESVLVRGTQSCTWNKCNFCYMSQGYPFMAASPEHMEKEILAQKKQFGNAPTVFMVGSNPFTLPFDTLRQYAELLRKHFPGFTKISMHSRIDDIEKKSDDALQRLHNLGILHLFIGTENGNEDALKIMNKGHTVEEARVQLRRLDAAGIAYTCQYIIGMAGKGKGLESGTATAEFLNSVSAERVMSTGLTVFPGSGLPGMVRNGAFIEAPEKEKIEELLAFFEHLAADLYFEGIHYLNPLNFRFRTGDATAKQRVIAEIKNVLAAHSEEELERAVNRKAMRSL